MALRSIVFPLQWGSGEHLKKKKKREKNVEIKLNLKKLFLDTVGAEYLGYVTWKI